MEFWNDLATQKSWTILKKINTHLHFTLIGDWAIYLYTKAIKSKDIDIILSWDDLDTIKKKYDPRKNDRLKKYEIIIDDIDIDTYLPHYSQLIIPCEDLQTMTISKEGFTLLKSEPLLILKQQAHQARQQSPKGQKDRIDILSLLHSNTINPLYYNHIIKRYGLQNFAQNLKKTIKTANQEFTYLHITNPRTIKQLKEHWIEQFSQTS